MKRITSDMTKKLVQRYGGDNATVLDMQIVLILWVSPNGRVNTNKI